MSTKIALFAVGFVVAWFGGLMAPTCWARSANVIVAKEGKAVPKELAEQRGWPEGTLALVNHRLRTVGWHYTFNTDPMDRTYFAYRARTPADVQENDVQEILDAFVPLKGSILLDPQSKPPANGVTLRDVSEDEGVFAVFSVGSQVLLDQWYGSLPKQPDGTRKVGKREYRQPPVASPPLLTLYVGNPAVKLEELKLPGGVQVVAANLDNVDAAIADEIRQFVEKHKRE